jgi:hypothetical protein
LARKEASVLRDDVTGHLDELIHAYIQKTSLVNRYITSEKEKRHSLTSENVELFTDLLKDDEATINEISGIDFKIARTRDLLSASMGIHPIALNDTLNKLHHQKIDELHTAQEEFKRDMSMLNQNRETIINDLEKLSARMKEDISEIKKIISLHYKKIDDPR